MRMIKALHILFFVIVVTLLAAPVQAKDTPYSNFNFVVVIDGVRLGGFTEVSGLTTETDIVEYRDGSSGEGRQMAIDGDIESARKNGSIIIYDKDMAPFATFHFENGWPVKVVGPVRQSGGSDVALEELTLAVEYLVRTQ